MDTNAEAKFSFATLNLWRKAYLGLVMITYLPLGILVVLANFGEGSFPMAVFVGGGLIALPLWTYRAVCVRKLNQLWVLSALKLITGNPVGCLIMLSIGRVTKKEIEAVAV
ncbi:MAG: hypothetical protein ABJ308_13165 [Halieaceae bacterium]